MFSIYIVERAREREREVVLSCWVRGGCALLGRILLELSVVACLVLSVPLIVLLQGGEERRKKPACHSNQQIIL